MAISGRRCSSTSRAEARFAAGRRTRRPVGWALRTLGFDLEAGTPERSAIQRSFRQSLIEAHPDHGGADDEAAQRIADITEARRILLAS